MQRINEVEMAQAIKLSTLIRPIVQNTKDKNIEIIKGETMVTGFTVRIDLGDMVLWYEVFANNPQSALEIVAKEKMSIGTHAMINSEFLSRLSGAVVSEMPYCYSLSNAQFEFDDKEIYIDVIKTWNTPGQPIEK